MWVTKLRTKSMSNNENCFLMPKGGVDPICKGFPILSICPRRRCSSNLFDLSVPISGPQSQLFSWAVSAFLFCLSFPNRFYFIRLPNLTEERRKKSVPAFVLLVCHFTLLYVFVWLFQHSELQKPVAPNVEYSFFFSFGLIICILPMFLENRNIHFDTCRS